jgi:hypothetical protein
MVEARLLEMSHYSGGMSIGKKDGMRHPALAEATFRSNAVTVKIGAALAAIPNFVAAAASPVNQFLSACPALLKDVPKTHRFHALYAALGAKAALTAVRVLSTCRANEFGLRDQSADEQNHPTSHKANQTRCSMARNKSKCGPK